MHGPPFEKVTRNTSASETTSVDLQTTRTITTSLDVRYIHFILIVPYVQSGHNIP